MGSPCEGVLTDVRNCNRTVRSSSQDIEFSWHIAFEGAAAQSTAWLQTRLLVVSDAADLFFLSRCNRLQACEQA